MVPVVAARDTTRAPDQPRDWPQLAAHQLAHIRRRARIAS